MATLNVTLSDSMCTYLEEQIAKGKYGTPSDYIRELIGRDQAERVKRNLLAKLEESLDSPAKEMVSNEWLEIREEGLRRLNADKPQ